MIDALRPARCPRGVEQAVGILGTATPADRATRPRRQDEIGVIGIVGVIRFVEGDPVVDIDSRAQTPHGGPVVTVIHERLEPGVADDETDLVRRQTGVERDEHDAALGGGEDRVEELDAIAGQNPDPVSGAKTEAVEPHPRAANRPPVELGIGGASSGGGLHQGGAIGRQPGARAEDVGADQTPPLPRGRSGDSANPDGRAMPARRRIRRFWSRLRVLRVAHRFRESDIGGLFSSASPRFGGGSARAVVSTSRNRSGHSRCGTWPQPLIGWSRARGNPSTIRWA